MRLAKWLTVLVMLLLPLVFSAQAQERSGGKVGVLLLHGKNPGSPNTPSLNILQKRLEREGMLTRMPDMPWSAKRYIDGDWDKAMAEINGHVQSLRKAGAERIVLIGHSMGCPASMGYAVRPDSAVDAIVLLAPGHVPSAYFNIASLKTVRDSILEARRLAAEGQGATRKDFIDNNQGQFQKVRITAQAYLSYFDPEGDAEMSRTAPRIPAQVPVLLAIGNEDPLFSRARSFIFDALPANPKSRYLEAEANHVSTPSVVADDVAAWIAGALSP